MPADCLKIIKSKSKVRQTRAKVVVAKVSSNSSTPAVSADVAELEDMVRALLLDKKNQYSAQTSSPTPASIKAVEPNCVTCGGNHAYQNCPATCGNVYQDNIQEYVSQAAAANYDQGNTVFRPQMVENQIRPLGFPPVQNTQNNFNRGNNFNQTRGTLPGNTVTNPKEDLKGITTRSGVAYQGPTIPTPFKVANQGTEPVVAPVSASMPNLKPSIPYPLRHDNERRRDQANEQIEKFYEIFKEMSFDISFTDALTLMPKFASTLKAHIGNKEKLSEMARTPMNEHCSAVILNKLPKKLGDPRKFLIPCEFPGMDECLALADLGASINLMPLSVWKGLSLPELTPTCMTLELADRMESKPVGIAKDVKVKVAPSLTPAPVKAVEPNCVTCGGTQSYQNCLATNGNIYRDNIQEYVSQAATANYNQGNTGFRPQMVANQIRPPGFPPNQNNQNNFNQGNNFNQNQGGNFNQGQLHRPQWDDVIVNQDLDDKDEDNNNDGIVLTGAIYLLVMVRVRMEVPIKSFRDYKAWQNVKRLNDTLCHGLTVEHNKEEEGRNMRIDKCLALADLGVSINLMPLFVWEGLSLPKLTPTCMTLELADRSVSKPIGIAKDVSVKVRVFHFPADFVVVDFEPDPRVPLILGRCFLKTGRALIDVHKSKLTLQYSQEVLGFSDVTTSGNPTPYDDPIVSTTSPTLTPFEDSDFLLFEEADAFLVPSFKKELKVCEAKTVKSSVDEPLEVELKDLPPHLEYAFLEGDNKLPVIIAKELGDEEKSALIKVLKSHKRAIAWKLSDIHGINPEFYTHKILMVEEYKPEVQHQRRVNTKIHDIIKKEVEKLLDAGLIYPISDSS
nr:reverse transcriptase domain-containing protein [Tanacetum cinerariifolium]